MNDISMIGRSAVKWKDVLVLFAGVLVGVGLGVLVFYGIANGKRLFGAQEIAAGKSLSASPAIGSAAPDFELLNLAGEQIRLSEMRGTAVLINFWATWCGPCRLEMPAIQERYERYYPELAVLAVNFDEPVDEVQKFVDELGLTFEVLLDPGATVQDLYRVRGYPTTYLVDEGGIVRVYHIGLMTEGQLDRYLAQVGVGK
jgi:peroxiredoxin